MTLFMTLTSSSTNERRCCYYGNENCNISSYVIKSPHTLIQHIIYIYIYIYNVRYKLYNINYTYKFGVSKCFLNVFERSLLCSVRLHLCDQKYSKNSNVLKYCHLKNFSNNFFCNLFLVMVNKKCSAIVTPVFRVKWSFRNHSNMVIWCSRNISYYYKCWKQRCLILFWKLIFF